MDSEYITYDGDLAERELEENQENLNEIAKEFTSTLKNNYKITKIWFFRKFNICIKYKSREKYEDRAEIIYSPIKRKTKIGCEDFCDILLQSFSQSLLVITQTDDFATIYEPKCLYPEHGARIEVLTTTLISSNDKYRIGKSILSISSANQQSLIFSLSLAESEELTHHSITKTVTIGSSPESNLQFPDNSGQNYRIKLKKINNSWTLRNLNPNLHIWKFLTSKNPANGPPLIHPLCPNQLIHLGGSQISLKIIIS